MEAGKEGKKEKKKARAHLTRLRFISGSCTLREQIFPVAADKLHFAGSGNFNSVFYCKPADYCKLMSIVPSFSDFRASGD